MYGLIDARGNVVLPFEFEYMAPPTCGLVHCKRPGGKDGFLDLGGNTAIPFQFDSASSFDTESQLAWVMTRGTPDTYHLIDRTGRMVTKRSYESVGFPRFGRARFEQSGRYGFLDDAFEVVLRPRFLGATEFSCGLAGVCLEKDSDKDRFYYIDTQGRIVHGP